jgi:NADPH:quinone reductase-like Zn-dependent oxidoreductase
VTDLRPGDEVFGSLWDNGCMLHPPGTFAELTVVPASCLVKKPDGVSFEETASARSGLTALLAMRDAGRVAPGRRVLINAASGSVGTLAVPIVITT